MQERELDYYNRKRFIEQLRVMHLHSFGDVGTYDKIIVDDTASCNNKTKCKLLHEAFVEMLDKINTGIYENTLNGEEVEFMYPTGHYFTDWLTIVLHKAINEYCKDPKLTITKYSIGAFCFYTKNAAILIFEKIIDRAIAIWNFRAEDKHPFAGEFRTYYSGLVSDTLEWIKESYFPKYKIVNTDENLYIYKREYVNFLYVSEDGRIITSDKEANTNTSKMSRFSGLDVQELSSIIKTPSTLLDLYNGIIWYRSMYAYPANTGTWKVSCKLIDYGKNDISIEGKLSSNLTNASYERKLRNILFKYRKSKVELIAKEMVMHWANNRAIDGTMMSVGDVLRLNKDLITISVENTYDCFRVKLEVGGMDASDDLYFARHFVKVSKIDIRRETGNTNAKTFDFVTAEVTTAALDKNKLMEYVKVFKDKLLEEVLNKLRSSKRYTNYGVPVEYLHLHDIVITCDGAAIFMFELNRLPSETTKED